MPLRCGAWEWFLKAVKKLVEIIHHRGWKMVKYLNSDSNLDYLFIPRLPYTRKVVSSPEDEELVYLFYYFGFPSTLVF